MTESIWGFRRADGSFGIRNHVVVIAAMDNVNPVVRRICDAVKGTVPVCVAYGRGQFGADLEQHDRVLLGYATHPNVAAALIVGLEPVTTQRLADAVAATGRPVQSLDVQGLGGTVQAVAQGTRAAAALVIETSGMVRVPVPAGELVVGVECGASDATSGLTANTTTGRVADWLVEAGGTVILSETDEIVGAEHALAQRAADPAVARQVLDAVARLEQLSQFQGIQLWPLGQDNIAGGLTTVEEKSLGAVRKGGTSALQQVVGYGEKPSRNGLVFMDAPAPGVENIAALAAGGAHLILFNTGVGNPIGHPLSPTVKLTGNPRTAQHFGDNIDVDVSGILQGSQSVDDAALALRGAMLAVANGRMTRSEILDDTEISISRVELGFVRHLREQAAGTSA
ncbi:UxaA family hydrolase [Hydrogenophaga sp. 2FB]|uniref:UxaA family hydrolase n=1 Tax=Hydrogenophaga sp. 2FB TaxID=2502187 RepID=UPI0010F81EE9|nr:UxaA family hydrolase [Hydrogenophaga sp. 2FB]